MLKRIGLAIVLCLGMSVCANAQTAAQQTCAIKTSLIQGGAKAANEKVAEFFAWNKNINLTSFNASFGVLYKLKIVEVGAFEFGAIGDFYQRHLVVATAEGNSSIYLVLDYEKVASTIRLFNVNMNTGAKKMLNGKQFFAPPEPLSC